MSSLLYFLFPHTLPLNHMEETSACRFGDVRIILFIGATGDL